MLTRNEILKEIEEKNILISSLNNQDRFTTNTDSHCNQVAECSIDLHLGNVILEFVKGETIDFKQPVKYREIEVRYGESIMLRPNYFYLLCTKEVVYTNRFALQLMLKSSIARNGIMHTLSGLVEPCFNDVITLEAQVQQPTILYTGMPFCQVMVNELRGDVAEYNGQYKGNPSWRPTPSKIYNKLNKQTEW